MNKAELYSLNIEVIRGLRAEIDALKEALFKRGEHHPWCALVRSKKWAPCDCAYIKWQRGEWHGQHNEGKRR